MRPRIISLVISFWWDQLIQTRSTTPAPPHKTLPSAETLAESSIDKNDALKDIPKNSDISKPSNVHPYVPKNPVCRKKILGTLALSILKSVHPLISPMIFYKLCSVVTSKY